MKKSKKNKNKNNNLKNVRIMYSSLCVRVCMYMCVFVQVIFA